MKSNSLKPNRLVKRGLMVLLVVIGLLGLIWIWLPGYREEAVPSVAPLNAAEQISRGAYLAKAGDCFACHTSRGGKPYAGGRELQTPYGSFLAPNITPDKQTGLGAWSADDFWRALHYGKSRDGRYLYPAFPYPSYTKVSREDADALFAYLQSLPAVNQANQPHTLRFPYNQRSLMRIWQGLFFRPGTYSPAGDKSAQWNRGAYLVQGLGHCGACHTSRNALGASDAHGELAGGMIPIVDWYAPSLFARQEANLAQADSRELVALLKTGVSPKHAVYGPMAEVVYESLQHLTEADVQAMAAYLQSLPESEAVSATAASALPEHEREAMHALGKRLYEKECVACHRAGGEGHAAVYPPLAGNHSMLMASAVNPIRMVLNGGFPPGTAGNPRPYGMPPFGPSMSDREVAAVVSYIRTSWGNKGSMVSPVEVAQYRTVPAD